MHPVLPVLKPLGPGPPLHSLAPQAVGDAQGCQCLRHNAWYGVGHAKKCTAIVTRGGVSSTIPKKSKHRLVPHAHPVDKRLTHASMTLVPLHIMNFRVRAKEKCIIRQRGLCHGCVGALKQGYNAGTSTWPTLAAAPKRWAIHTLTSSQRGLWHGCVRALQHSHYEAQQFAVPRQEERAIQVGVQLSKQHDTWVKAAYPLWDGRRQSVRQEATVSRTSNAALHRAFSTIPTTLHPLRLNRTATQGPQILLAHPNLYCASSTVPAALRP